MDKQCLAVVLMLVFFGMVSPVPAEVVLLLTFDTDPAENLESYPFAATDIPSSGTMDLYFGAGLLSDFGRPSGLPETRDAVDYGLDYLGGGPTNPENYRANPEHYPNIVTPPIRGPQGGNAFFTHPGDIREGTGLQGWSYHTGWYFSEQNQVTISGDFTAEALVMMNQLQNVTGEHGIHNFFGNEKINWTDAVWKFRYNPFLGLNRFQLVTTITTGRDPGLGEIIIDSLGDATALKWHHLAAVYDSTTNTISFYVDQVFQGSANPSWNNTEQNDWWIGDWPAIATRAMAGWLDAVCLSNEVLTPETFVLTSYGLTGTDGWETYR